MDDVDAELASIRDDFARLGAHVFDTIPSWIAPPGTVARLQFSENLPADAHPMLTGPVVHTVAGLAPAARVQILRILWQITSDMILSEVAHTPSLDLNWQIEEGRGDDRQRYRVLNLGPDDFTITG